MFWCYWQMQSQSPAMKGAICSICAEQFDSTHDVSALKCGHIFHADCISQWLTQSMTCPQCREQVVRTAVIQKLYFSRPDSIAGSETNTEQELSRVSSMLEEAQSKLRVQDQEMSSVLAHRNTIIDHVKQLIKIYRLSTVPVCWGYHHLKTTFKRKNSFKWLAN